MRVDAGGILQNSAAGGTADAVGGVGKGVRGAASGTADATGDAAKGVRGAAGRTADAASDAGKGVRGAAGGTADAVGDVAKGVRGAAGRTAKTIVKKEPKRAVQDAEVQRLSAQIAPCFYAVHRDIQAHGHVHYLLTGGRGSGKSTFVAIEVLLLLKKHPDCHALVLRKVAGTLRDSVYGQYVWVADMLGILHEYEQRAAPPELIYRATGQRILFRGADDRAKIKSLKMPFGYIGITHFEEKDQFESRTELRSILQSTMRGGPLFWNFETSNPPARPAHWTNREVSGVLRADMLHHHGDYRAMPRAFLGEQFFAEAEALRARDETAWRHEYLGLAVGVGAQVFANVQLRALTDSEICAFDRIYMGVDWGYFPDPFVFVKTQFDAARRVLYLFDEVRAVRQSNAETAARCKKKGATTGSVWADSAEPKSVADYRAAGILCRSVSKGAGSVVYSMKWLASLASIVIDPVRCPCAAREFAEYEHERDASDEVTEGYPDRDNHAIDAVRYALYPVWKRKGQ